MHCMWSNGLFCHALYDWYREARAIKGIRFCHLSELINADWKCPFAVVKHLSTRRDAFSKKREKAANRAGVVKLQASDGLTLYPLIRRFAETHAMDEDLEPHTKTLLALMDVGDVLQQAKKRQYHNRETMAHLLRDLVVRFLKARLITQDVEDTLPKHHCTMHLWKQFLEDGWLLDTWVLERMHLLLKTYEEDVKCTRQFEKTVITRAVIERSRQLQRATIRDELVGPCVEGVARELVTRMGERFHVDDLVFPSGDLSRCCVVRACVNNVKLGLLLPWGSPLGRICSRSGWRDA